MWDSPGRQTQQACSNEPGGHSTDVRPPGVAHEFYDVHVVQDDVEATGKTDEEPEKEDKISGRVATCGAQIL